LFKPGDSEGLARQLREWRDNPGIVADVKERSKQLGESVFCWDKEKNKLLCAVEEALAR